MRVLGQVYVWVAVGLCVGVGGGSAGCDGSASAPPGATDTSVDSAADAAPRVIPPAPVPGQQLLTDEYTLQPGEEKYFCYTFTSPSDAQVGIVSVDNIAGDLVHHVALFRALVPEEEGFHECNVLIKLSWMPIWAGGTGGNGLVLPDQVAFEIGAGTQYVVQYHLLNATPRPVTERSAINLGYVDDLTGYEPAGIFAMGKFDLTIPKDATGFTQEVGCTVDKGLNVFAVFPHMHTLGKKLELFKGPDADNLSVAYAIDPWPFGDQPFDRVDFRVEAGEYVRSRCTWDNDTGHDVTFGESTFDEMCFTVMFAYPMPDIDGCGFGG